MGIAEASVVADIGAGSGWFTIRLARRVGPQGLVYAEDVQPEMLTAISRRVQREGLTNVEARVMDGQALELPDASFDAALSMFGIFLFADRPRALAELHRVVRPGGRVLSTSWATFEHNTLLGVGVEAMRAALPDLPRPAGPLPTQNPEVCASELTAAGFREVSARIVKASARYASAAAYWSAFDRASAQIGLLKTKLGDAFPAAAERIQAELRARLGDAPFELQAAAIFASGVR